MSAGIGDAVDEDDEGMYVCPPILRAYELAKKREAYIACQCHHNPIPLLNTFHNRSIALLFAAIYGMYMMTKNNGGGFPKVFMYN